jgi:plastocyanin
MSQKHSLRAIGSLVIACAFGLAACGEETTTEQAEQPAAAQPAQLNVETHDFKFGVSAESVPAGMVEIVHENAGKEPHQVQLLKLNEGVAFDELKRYATTRGPEAAKTLQVTTVAGGIGETSPGKTASGVFELEEGSYALICFVRGHNTKGMIQPFEVTAAEEDSFEEPSADAEIGLTEYAFSVPEDFTGGMVRFTNNGEQPHEAGLFRLEGVTLDELNAYLQKPKGPPPGKEEPEAQGSISAISPGTSAWANLDSLEPGVYAFVCFVPDQEKLPKQVPHFALGMASGFEVK